MGRRDELAELDVCGSALQRGVGQRPNDLFTIPAGDRGCQPRRRATDELRDAWDRPCGEWISADDALGPAGGLGEPQVEVALPPRVRLGQAGLALEPRAHVLSFDSDDAHE